MYANEIAVKEINQYYARRGGRTTSIKNYANVGSFADQMKRAMAFGQIPSPIQTQKKASAAQEETSTANKETSASKEDTKQTDKNYCCDACRQTSQLTMQLWRNLYLQNGLGSFSTGAGALTAYQSLKNALGSSLL